MFYTQVKQISVFVCMMRRHEPDSHLNVQKQRDVQNDRHLFVWREAIPNQAQKYTSTERQTKRGLEMNR